MSRKLFNQLQEFCSECGIVLSLNDPVFYDTDKKAYCEKHYKHKDRYILDQDEIRKATRKVNGIDYDGL